MFQYASVNQTAPLEARLLDIAKTAQRYSSSRRTVKRWLDRGLPFFQAAPGSKILIKPEDVEAFLTRHCRTQVDLNALVDEVMAEIVAKQPK